LEYFIICKIKRLLSKIEEASTQISAINKIEYLKRNTNSIFDAVDNMGDNKG